MKPHQTNEQKVLAGLERIITLLEDIFILQASQMAMNKESLRQILRIDKRRIGRIAKYVKEEKQRGARN